MPPGFFDLVRKLLRVTDALIDLLQNHLEGIMELDFALNDKRNGRIVKFLQLLVNYLALLNILLVFNCYILRKMAGHRLSFLVASEALVVHDRLLDATLLQLLLYNIDVVKRGRVIHWF